MPFWSRQPKPRLRRGASRRAPVIAEVQVLHARILLSAPDAGGEILGEELPAAAEHVQLPAQIQSLLQSRLGETGGLLHGVLSAPLGKVHSTLETAGSLFHLPSVDRAALDSAFSELAASRELDPFQFRTALTENVSERLDSRIQHVTAKLDHVFGLIDMQLAKVQSRLDDVFGDDPDHEIGSLFGGLREKLQEAHTQLDTLLSGLGNHEDDEMDDEMA